MEHVAGMQEIRVQIECWLEKNKEQRLLERHRCTLEDKINMY